jgi:hypothetical protein
MKKLKIKNPGLQQVERNCMPRRPKHAKNEVVASKEEENPSGSLRVTDFL